MNSNTKLFINDNKKYNNSIITPVFKTSTFCFENSEQGEKLFQEKINDKYVYSRIDHPNMVETEKKISLFDNSEQCALFSSGMSAISTSLLTFLNPNDKILYSNPVYGGTNNFFQKFLKKFMIQSIPFECGISDIQKMADLIIKNNIKIIFI